MSQLIGKINYPAESVGLAVEYCTLFSEGEENLLVFRLINRGEKAVNAYRIEVLCDDGETQKCSVERRNIEINNGETSEEHEVHIPLSTEEGKIIISTVIYDDLSHNESAVSFPFASFDAISRVADAILSNGKPKADISSSTYENSYEQEDERDYSQPEKESTEAHMSNSPLPLILAISAVVSGVLIFCLLNVMNIGGF